MLLFAPSSLAERNTDRNPATPTIASRLGRGAEGAGCSGCGTDTAGKAWVICGWGTEIGAGAGAGAAAAACVVVFDVECLIETRARA